MSDQAAPGVTPPPEPTPGNSDQARSPTGEILDQQKTQPDGSANKDVAKADDTAKPADDKAKDDKAKAGPGKVPDKYEFKAPKGQEIDAKAVEAATPILKELGIDQAGAQKLFDFMAARDQAAAEATNKAYETTRSGWRDEVVKSDLGDGKADIKPEVKANVAKAIESLGDAKVQAAFKEAMNITGAGDNPTFVRAFNTLGKLLSEGSAVRGGNPSPAGQAKPGDSGKPTPAQALYPKLPTSATP